MIIQRYQRMVGGVYPSYEFFRAFHEDAQIGAIGVSVSLTELAGFREAMRVMIETRSGVKTRVLGSHFYQE